MCWLWLSALDSAQCVGIVVGGSGSRSFGGFAKILRLQGLQGLRSSGAGGPAASDATTACVERSCGRYKNKCFSSSTENHF
jgi:hypothetical protein